MAGDGLKKVEGHIVSMHYKDMDQKKRDVPYGAGVNHAAEQLTKLKRQGFQGVLTIEYEDWSEHQRDDLLKCVAYLNEQAARLVQSSSTPRTTP